MSSATVIIRFRFLDWAKAREFIDTSNAQRKRFTATRHSLVRDLSDPRRLTAVVSFEDLAQAQAWVATSIDPIVVQDVEENAGLSGQPEIWIGEDIDDVDY